MLQRLGGALSRLSERYVPDAWIICLMLTAIAIAWAGPGADPLTSAWGDGVWTLLPLAMQFTLALVAAHACATPAPV